jgi:hypothetical protein
MTAPATRVGAMGWALDVEPVYGSAVINSHTGASVVVEEIVVNATIPMRKRILTYTFRVFVKTSTSRLTDYYIIDGVDYVGANPLDDYELGKAKRRILKVAIHDAVAEHYGIEPKRVRPIALDVMWYHPINTKDWGIK